MNHSEKEIERGRERERESETEGETARCDEEMMAGFHESHPRHERLARSRYLTPLKWHTKKESGSLIYAEKTHRFTGFTGLVSIHDAWT